MWKLRFYNNSTALSETAAATSTALLNPGPYYIYKQHHTLLFTHINHFHHTKKSQAKMRMSCNGCRVLRKGCTDDCSIRPCLQWIASPESQAHATVFLAKFYGRAGLMNLINAGPDHLRPGTLLFL